MSIPTSIRENVWKVFCEIQKVGFNFMDNYQYRDLLTCEFLQPILTGLTLLPGRSGTDAEHNGTAFSLKSAKVSKKYKGKMHHGKWQTSGMNWQYDKIHIEEKWKFDINHPMHILSIFDEDLSVPKQSSIEVYPLVCFIFDKNVAYKEMIIKKREERLKILKEKPNARDNISIFLKDIINLPDVLIIQRDISGIPLVVQKWNIEKLFGWKM